MNLTTFTEKNRPSQKDKNAIIDFLYINLEDFGDPKNEIEKAIDYSLKNSSKSNGGFITVAYDGNTIVGAVVVNETGMEGYIPENILVYIATHHNYRGQGVGKMLMECAIAKAEGGIALHVEPHNPAKHLYERLGFTNKYLEMRLNN